MHDLSTTIADSLIQSYQDGAQRVHTLAQNLTEEQFWQNPYPYGNSFGTLVVHLTGNLNYYIGAEIAETGYVRDRPREFETAPTGAKAKVLAQFATAVAQVVDTLHEQTEPDWARAYHGTLSTAQNRLEIFLSCAVHLRHHVGQMMYVVQALTNDA